MARARVVSSLGLMVMGSNCWRSDVGGHAAVDGEEQDIQTFGW